MHSTMPCKAWVEQVKIRKESMAMKTVQAPAANDKANNDQLSTDKAEDFITIHWVF